MFETSRRPSWIAFGIALALAVVCTAPFWPSAAGTWVLDDLPLIANNPNVQGFAHAGRWFTSDFWAVDTEAAQLFDRLSYWRPAVLASYGLDWIMGGGSPRVFHLTNLLWHGMATILVFLTLRRWTKDTVAAAIAAMLFAVHPSKAEAVAWIAGRTDPMCTTWMLLALVGTSLRLAGDRRGWLVEVPSIVLAFMSKEVAVVLPAIAAVEGWVSLGKPGMYRESFGPMGRAAAPSLIAVAWYTVARATLIPFRSFQVTGLSGTDHGWLVFETFGRYLQLVVWPRDLSLEQAPIRTAAGGLIVSWTHVAAGAVGLMVLGAVCVWAMRRKGWMTASIGVVIAALLPVSNVVFGGFQVSMSPRFLYLPLFGVAALIAWSVASTQKWRTAALVIVGLIAVVLASRSWLRSHDFQNQDTFWAYEIERNPESLDAIDYHRQKAIAQGRNREALAWAAKGHAAASHWFGHTGRAGDFVVWAVESLAKLTPDADEPTMRALRQFCDDVVERRNPTARLQVGDLGVEVPVTKGKVARRLALRSPHLRAVRADISSRIGDDKLVVADAIIAVQSCMVCPGVVSMSVVACMRAGNGRVARSILESTEDRLGSQFAEPLRKRVDDATRLMAQSKQVSGPLQMQLSARAYMVTGGWGRAYRVLEPASGPISEDPEAAIVLAEVAWRAGYFGPSKDLLAKIGMADRADALTSDWSRQMGW